MPPRAQTVCEFMPLKAARRYAIAKAKCFWGRGTYTSDLISIAAFTSLCSAALFGSQQGHLPPSVW